jgi:acylpyruvate hydrolase
MKIVCIGRNYAEHAKELNNPLPKTPVIFLKPKSALVRVGSPVIYPQFTDDLQYECEVVLRVCKNGVNIPQKFARQYFNAWSVGVDFTARDIQQQQKEAGLPWEIAKAFDNSAVVGEFEAIDYSQMYSTAFSLSKNGAVVQKGHTSDLIFSFEYIISYVSQFFTLQIGDLIYTGTPAGVGPVLPSDTLEGFLNHKKMFEVQIR